MKVFSLFLILAALMISTVLGAGDKDRFSHAEFTYPAGQYGQLNAVSIKIKMLRESL